MYRTFIGLRFKGDVPLEACSEIMRNTLRALVEKQRSTFDRLLFPYADTLLLFSGAARNNLFGTHALLLGFDAEALADAVFSARGGFAVEELEPEACSLPLDRGAIADFLSEGRSEGNHEYIGDFASLLSADVRTYDIRDAARRLCSFCEQAARTEGVVLHGLSGGSVCADVQPEAVDGIIKLYRDKTGGNAVS